MICRKCKEICICCVKDKLGLSSSAKDTTVKKNLRRVAENESGDNGVVHKENVPSTTAGSVVNDEMKKASDSVSIYENKMDVKESDERVEKAFKTSLERSSVNHSSSVEHEHNRDVKLQRAIVLSLGDPGLAFDGVSTIKESLVGRSADESSNVEYEHDEDVMLQKAIKMSLEDREFPVDEVLKVNSAKYTESSGKCKRVTELFPKASVNGAIMTLPAAMATDGKISGFSAHMKKIEPASEKTVVYSAFCGDDEKTENPNESRGITLETDGVGSADTHEETSEVFNREHWFLVDIAESEGMISRWV